MKENAVYQFSNAYFRMKLTDGFITSIQPGQLVPGFTDTEYVYPGNRFGQLILEGQSTAGVFNWRLEPGQGESTLEPGLHKMKYKIQGEQGGVVVSQCYELEDQELTQTITLRNRGTETVTIEDLCIPLPCNTRFEWGQSAADKVIGHHFVAGHGSHLLFERCDGQGPILMMLPQNGTSLEYYAAEDAIDLKQKGSYLAYIHSANARRAAVEAGARPHVQATEAVLEPGDERTYTFLYVWARDNEDAREQLVRYGLIDVEVLPGMTVPENTDVHLSLRSLWHVTPILPEGAELLRTEISGDRVHYTLRFSRLGERTIRVEYAENRFMNLDFFVTQPMKTLIQKRGRFIAGHQHRDPEKWYYGLLAEWNNETGVMLGPDNYDTIKGWRIYEVTCDDPGLSKPAFLSGKLALYPNEEEIRAMDLYVENFVWGGLQCTEEEEYPYAIYGIPDWKQNRESEDEDIRGKLHIWRVYDYPHIFLMYYNLYRIAKKDPQAPLTHDRMTYLTRAYRTALALFTVPAELDAWSAYETGFYNELVIEDILASLKEEGLLKEHRRLERLWNRKVQKFVLENADVFGSEYPFDTTGFESTHALAKRALSSAEYEDKQNYWEKQIMAENAWRFMESQMRCNVSCRGVLEPAYYWYGSDYRSSNIRYTLSYMSQMAGASILDYALYYAKDPFPMLRLGYGSLLSSWALLNSGEADTNYGYWFPGEQHDGAASGGYEPQYLGETWLQQPHHGGPWYYSCEIDLGFCGYLRGAATILMQDPIFGQVCLGGTVQETDAGSVICPQDGVNQRVHYVDDTVRLHVLLDEGHILEAVLSPDRRQLRCRVDLTDVKNGLVHLAYAKNTEKGQTLTLKADANVVDVEILF